jgi:hypothetical protein
MKIDAIRRHQRAGVYSRSADAGLGEHDENDCETRTLPVMVSSVIAMWGAHQDARSGAAALAQPRPSIHITRIYTGPDGQSHAEELDPKLGPPDALGLEHSDAVKVTSANFVRFAPSFFEDWHHAHARRYVITLSGRGEAEIAGGQKIPMEPGHALLFEDLTGKGHISRALTPDWTAVFIQLDQ